jgi:two-component system cell cycle response regulator DivK
MTYRSTQPDLTAKDHVMPTVLIVEDNDASRDALARRLQRRDYQVLTAVDGREGVAVARSAKPDLILMDLGLPGIDGWDATAQIKMDPELRHIPIIVLSAHAMPNDRHQAMAAGGDDFDTKPVDFARLLGKIETLLPGNRPDAALT